MKHSLRKFLFLGLAVVGFSVATPTDGRAQAKAPAWWNWPSYVTEAGSGLIVATIVQPYPSVGPLKGELLRIGSATALSIGYECSGLDVNGCQFRDLWQREIGIVVGVVAWHYLRKALHW